MKATTPQEALAALIRQLREAADDLEKLQGGSPQRLAILSEVPPAVAETLVDCHSTKYLRFDIDRFLLCSLCGGIQFDANLDPSGYCPGCAAQVASYERTAS